MSSPTKGDVMLKATGIIRRVDELGRIVVPKELRSTLRIKDGTSLEIYTNDNGELVLKNTARWKKWRISAKRCAML